MKMRKGTTTLTDHQRMVEELYAERLMVRDILKEYEDDWDLVDELMQDVYVAALTSEYDGKAKPTTWLGAIARNIGVDHVRAAQADKRQGEVLECYIEPASHEEADGEYAVPYYDRTDLSVDLAEACWNLDPARHIEAEDTYAEALHRMPDQMAAVVQMRREGMTNPLIAKELGVSEKRVRNLVHESQEYFRDNQVRNTTNSVCERDGEPLARAARLSQSDVERAQRERFARRDSAFVKRQIRLRHPDLSLAEWKILYEREEGL